MALTIVPDAQKSNDFSKLEAPEMGTFAAYLKEHEGFDLLETAQGFAIYNFNEKECYIRDIYVKPEFRNSKVASQIADQVAVLARQAGCTFMSGSVSTLSKTATQSMRVLLGYGMRFHSQIPNGIFFVKDL